MNNYLDSIQNKIKKEINLEKITIIDNSHKHEKHKFFDKNKYHLKLLISSKYLKSFSRIEAQKIIMKILSEDLKQTIHALEIHIQ